ncbi:hypothetical protein E4U55_001132 [Claviceps digitariae]|nr:hypothetical protein E4U55_001132 [Claviceps digitariae]
MATQFAMQSFYRSTPLTVDTHHAPQKYLENDDKSCMLDDNSMEHSAVDSGLELSPPMATSRRESFAVGSALFSPKTEDWQSVDMQSVPSNSFTDQSGGNNGSSHIPFMRLDSAHSHVFPPQGNHWDMSGSSGNPQTAMQQFNQVQGAFNTGATIFQRPVPNSFSNPGNIFASLNTGDQVIPTSPPKEWMVPSQSMSKKMPSGSPMIRTHNDLRRGDGIRKKNARFDIPAERNLTNIDALISQSTDDQEIKELKQQKRLLRNRQAALDSRQRKKQHTERLEDEKKQYTAVINDLEEELAASKDKFDMLMQEKDTMVSYIERMTAEKEDIIRAHTVEAATLRQKVHVLAKHVQQIEGRSTSNTTTSGMADDFSDKYDGMDGIGVPGAWDQSNFLNDYPSSQQQQVRPPMSVLQAKKNEVLGPVDNDKGTSQGGLLFMLFLVGAFVISSRSMPVVPRVSEDIRAASATLLDTVFRDAGINPPSAIMSSIAPQPSGSNNWVHPPVVASAAGMTDMSMENAAPTMLEELGDSLTQPTQEQMNQHIFSLSAAQYDGVGIQEFLPNVPLGSSGQGRKNLAEALAAVRAAYKHGGVAEVYTRSLLWDQIPTEVVRNFAKMVAECNDVQNGQQCNESQ